MIIDGLDDSEDDIAKPYVVTIERGSGEILSIRRNWNEMDSATTQASALCTLRLRPRIWLLRPWFDPHHRGICQGGNVAYTAVGGRWYAV